MADGQLLRLFGFTKSLEEIDQMDAGRLFRALEALSLADAWKRYHEGNLKDRTQEDTETVGRLGWLARHYGE